MNNKIEFYYRQYVKNYRVLNMDFYEFLSDKLNCSEEKTIKIIRKWKKEKLINVI
jgi:predicted GIY-YIG superfamily endonuclease